MSTSTPPPPPSIRNTITQEAFAVAPQLLGLPLARPARRLTAILLDLLIVAFLVNLGGGYLFGIAAAYAFFRFAAKARGRGNSPLSRTARIAFRAGGALILFLIALSIWNRGRSAVNELSVFGGDDGERDGVPVTVVVGDTGSPRAAGIVQAARFTAEVVALSRADDEAEARQAATTLVREMRRMGQGEPEIRSTLTGTARGVADEDEDRAWMPGVVASVLEAELGPAPHALPPDSLAMAYAAAVAGNDSAAADSLRPRLASAIARDSLDALRGEVRELSREKEAAEERLEGAEDRGLLATLLELLDDLGLSFGWNALYFTAFTALWKGQTPGKRLLGIRVVKLNGQPMTLWGAFERFGGYAAGLLTGLLGFAQVYWDRNRQAIHDKITETVVIRVHKDQPLPAAAQRPAASSYAQRPSAGAWTHPPGGGDPPGRSFPPGGSFPPSGQGG